jgi:transaldolase
MMNPGEVLRRLGQSLWYDNIHRGLLESGELERLVRDYGIRGVTTNPTIFDKAISEGHHYDRQIEALASQGLTDEEIYTELVVHDVRWAADVLRPVYEASQGEDGYVSVEVSPALAYDAKGTVAAVESLWQRIDRPNVMIKIPGTREGLLAVEQCLRQGININVTLLFSVARYEEVAWAYIRAQEARLASGEPLHRVASVASFFVSRVDTLVDQELEARRGELGPEVDTLLGQTGIVNAKMAYQRFLAIVSHPRFCRLAEMGARPQRLLWASTSTKNPRYSDVMYVEGLIGPHTVNTVPQVTLEAFCHHGRAEVTLTQGVQQARAVVERLRSLGVDLEEVAVRLEAQGVELFLQSYLHTLESLARKRQLLQSGATAP